MPTPIPVTVVTGFLGAGKTTLVERWSAELPGVAVVVNEAGAIGIDGALLAQRVERLREITGGCVCCATQAELAAVLADLAVAEPAPVRVLVETSGAASPAGVVRAVTRGRAAARLRLDGIVTVLDATRVDRTLGFDLAVEQLGFADVVVLTHLDRCRDVDLDAVARRVTVHAPGAHLVRAERGRVAPDATLLELLAAREGVLRILPAEARGSHRAIAAVSLSVEGELDEDRFGDWVEAALGAVEARVLRVKGILALEGVDARVILQGVGDGIEVTLGEPWAEAARTSRMVVIGLDLDAEALEAGFRACAV